MAPENAWLAAIPVASRNITPYKSGKQTVQEWTAIAEGQLSLIPSKLAGMSLFYHPICQWRSANLHFPSGNRLPNSVNQVIVIHDITEAGGSIIGFGDPTSPETSWWCYIETKNAQTRINELLGESCGLISEKIQKGEELYYNYIEAAVSRMGEIVGVELVGELGERPPLQNNEERTPSLMPASSHSRHSSLETPTQQGYRGDSHRHRRSTGSCWDSPDRTPTKDRNSNRVEQNGNWDPFI